MNGERDYVKGVLKDMDKTYKISAEANMALADAKYKADRAAANAEVYRLAALDMANKLVTEDVQQAYLDNRHLIVAIRVLRANHDMRLEDAKRLVLMWANRVHAKLGEHLDICPVCGSETCADGTLYRDKDISR